jgi:hypothetical protein
MRSAMLDQAEIAASSRFGSLKMEHRRRIPSVTSLAYS